MKHTVQRLFVVFGMVVGMGLLFSPDARSADKYWRGDLYHEDEPDGDGPFDFSGTGNWAAVGAPEAGDRIIFTGFGDYAIPENSNFTVKLSADTPVLHQIEWRSNPFEMTVDLNGKVLTATGAFSKIGTPGSGAVVNLTGGTASFLNLELGDTASDTGSLYITGEGTSVNTTNTAASYEYIGKSGTGIFHVDYNANYTGSTRSMFYVGHNEGAHGTVKFTNNATALFRNHVVIGNIGSGALYIESGSQVTVTPFDGSRFVSFAGSGGSGQTVTGLITGEGSVFAMTGVTNAARGIGIGGRGDISDRDTAMQSQGSAHVTVEKEGRVESNMIIVLWDAGKLTVDNGTVTAGTHFHAYDGSEVEFVLHNANRDALIQVGDNMLIEDNVTLTLSLAEGASFTPGADFVKLIEYGDSLLDEGVFSNYTEGQTFSLAVPEGDTYTFEFTYAYSDGDDTFVGMHVIPEPGVSGLILLGLGAMAIRRKVGAIV